MFAGTLTFENGVMWEDWNLGFTKIAQGITIV